MIEKPSKEQLDAWTKDPNNWKWGFFYYNKEDKRIMPPKKNPAMGWTINFANKRSVITFLLFTLLPTAIILLFVLINK
jgi:uncharacterized membrane protein